MKPIFMGKKRHPLDKEMPCPDCGAITPASHYDDGELNEEGEVTLYTPMWVCDCCLHDWDIQDIKEVANETKPL